VLLSKSPKLTKGVNALSMRQQTTWSGEAAARRRSADNGNGERPTSSSKQSRLGERRTARAQVENRLQGRGSTHSSALAAAAKISGAGRARRRGCSLVTTTADGKGGDELVTRAASREVGGARRQAIGSTRRGDVFIEARRENGHQGIGIEGVNHY
jgi:hypothetical protein